MDFDVIFIVGPQGAGKGTQGKRLAEKLGFFFWDTGAILREISKEDTPLGKKVSAINQGILLSDDMIIEVLKEKLADILSRQGIIFDGVPRRIGQAEFLTSFLRENGKKNMATIFIDLPREESLKRLLLRAKKEGRIDDTKEKIERRLQYYEEATKPTIGYLKRETTFIEIDGRPSIDEITKEINTALGLTINNG